MRQIILFSFFILYSLGVCAQNAGMYRTLDETDIEIRYNMAPTNLVNQLDYAELLLRRERYAEASTLLSRVLTDEGTESHARFLLQAARVNLKGNKNQSARDFLETFYTTYGKSGYKDTAGIPLRTYADVLSASYYANIRNSSQGIRTMLQALSSSAGGENNVMVRVSTLMEAQRWFALINSEKMIL